MADDAVPAASAEPAPQAQGPPGATESSEFESDARLVRGVRWRLVAWSGGSTLLVLLALGIALYVSVASSLESNAVAALDQRATEIRSFGRPAGGGDNGPIDFLFGGGGTFANCRDPDLS